MRRLASSLVAVVALLAMVAPVATGATGGGPTVRITSYQPVKPLAVANASVSASNTIIMKYSGGTLEATTRSALINETVELRPGVIVAPHLYVWFFNNSGQVLYDGVYPSGAFSIDADLLFYNVSDAAHRVVTLGFNYGAYNGLEFRSFQYSRKMLLTLANGSAWFALYSTITIGAGKWYVMSARYNGSHIEIYINDSFAGAKEFAGNPAWDTSRGLSVGGGTMYGLIRYVSISTDDGIAFLADPTFYNGTVYIDLINGTTGEPTNAERIPDNATWFWIIDTSSNYVEFGWAPDGYAYYVYSNNTLIGIYYNGDKASLNGSHRVVLAPAPPKDITASNYGGVILYNLPAYSVVEFWLGGTRVKALEADGRGIVTVSLPQGNYTIRVYPPAWDPQHPHLYITLNETGEHVKLNLTKILEELGVSPDMVPIDVSGVNGWGCESGTLYLVNASKYIIVYLGNSSSIRRPIFNYTFINSNMILSRGEAITGYAPFDALDNGTIYATDTNTQAALYVKLNVTIPFNCKIKYVIRLKTGTGTKTGAGVAVAAYGNAVYAVRLQTGGGYIAVERLFNNGTYNDVYKTVYNTDNNKWYNLSITIYGNGTLEAFVDDNFAMTWKLPAGAQLVLGPYLNRDNPMWDFANVTVWYDCYKQVEPINVKSNTATVATEGPINTTSIAFNVSLAYTGAYSYMELFVNGSQVFMGPSGNLTLTINTTNDGVYVVEAVFLEPFGFRPIYNVSASARVDARPPVVRVGIAGLIYGTNNIVLDINVSDYKYISASINGTPINVTIGKNTVWLPEGLGKWYTIEIVAVDKHNRATIWKSTFYAWRPSQGTVEEVGPAGAANALVSFFSALTSSSVFSFLYSYINNYTFGVFGPALSATLIFAVWLKSRSLSLLFAVSAIFAWVLGIGWLWLVAALALAGVLFMAWRRS